MIRNGTALWALLLLVPSTARAQDSSPFFSDLVGEALGTSARPVRFDWRNRKALADVSLAAPLELNNFESTRFGVGVALPGQGFFPFFSLSYTRAKGTRSSEAVARTPYRQVGRPSHWELRGGGLFPLAEGIVTLRPSFVPAAEFVLSAKGTLSYLGYPSALKGKDAAGVLRALFSAKLTGSEIGELRKVAPGGMTIDTGRLDTLAGLSLSLFSSSGLFLTPEVQVAMPLLGSDLGYWWDVSLGVGYAL